MSSLRLVLLRTVSLSLITLVVKGERAQEEVGLYESTLLDDLQVICNQEGINVKLFFKQPFSGVAYSHGHYETPKCRYISHEDQVVKPSGTNFSFLIPINECGTVYHGGLGTPLRRLRNARDANNGNEVYIENTLLVQNDPTIQEAGDLAKTLRCVWQKEIHKPLVASLPFGNVNSKLTPMRFPEETHKVREVPSRSRTNYSSTAYNKGRLRFQMKGQVESVPAYRRHHSRSLPIDDDNDQTTESWTSSTTQHPPEVLRDQEEEAISALPLEGKRIVPRTSGSSTLRQSTLLFYTKFALSLTISLITTLLVS